MKQFGLVIAGATFFVSGGSGAIAQTVADAAPPVAQVDRLVACRGMTDPARRLECFDREVAGFADGVAKRELVVMDRAAVRSTKRTLFGLSLPRIGILDDDKEEITSLEGVIERVTYNRDGGWYFFLQGGARWTQIDGRPIALEPRPGDKVTIKKAALGSYMLSVGRQPGVRVRRVS